MRVSTPGRTVNWRQSWQLSRKETAMFGVDEAAAAASRARQEALAGMVLTDGGDRKGERVGVVRRPAKGNPKQVTAALLLERAQAQADLAAALAPPALRIEEPV